MFSNSSVQFLKHHQVNKQLWDDCINRSPNGLIYATSIYLDQMSPAWAAVVAPDYSWVMPLTCNTKFGISYLFQPPFTQQTGVFAKAQTALIPWEEIFTAVNKRYRFWEISFNYSTPQHVFGGEFLVAKATNFSLSLGEDYAAIRQAYHGDLKRNLNLSEKFRLVYRPLTDYEIAINEYKRHYAHRMNHVTSQDYERFRKLVQVLFAQNKVICRQVVNQQNELMATALLLSDGRRLYNMMNTTTAAGRKVAANHCLIDSMIQEFATNELVFDFEGSDLPGVKEFYRNFGAVNQPYFMARYNNLPWLLKLLKR